ncbi:hypothetical protein N665_0737s0002 [Sinapis alba]|nr:hypothetical protein N665_0737s0002 [Sinapis alba]
MGGYGAGLVWDLGQVGRAVDRTMEILFEQDKGERGGWRQLGRRGANGASCTHSATKSCLFAQAVKVSPRVLVGSFGPGSGLTSWYQSGVGSRIVLGYGKSPHFRLGLMGTRKSKTSWKGKEAAGGSGQVEADGTNPTVLLLIQPDGANVGAGLPNAQLDPTEVRVDGAGTQLEQELGPADGADEQKQRKMEDEAVPLAGRWVEQVAEVVRRMDYLKLLEHIAKMGTKHFAGSVDPLEADEWRSRLVRNFNSTHCPEDYQKDIAVHFLKGDAHNWWLSLDKRTNGTIERFSDFVVEFNHKYFPAVAWDRLEAKFLDLVQCRRTVRRFIRGLRVELRTYCFVRIFHTVSELVERMAMLETNLSEEAKLKIRSHPAATGGNSDRKRKRDQAEEGKSSSGRSACLKCGRHHGGECWIAMGACLRCGKMDHSACDCPRQELGAGGDTRTCHYCGRKGHLGKDCPKLSSGLSRSQGEASRLDQNRGQTSAPRVYELSKDEDKAGPFQAITETLSIGGVETHILFDTGATHSFVSLGMLGKGLFKLRTGDCPGVVNAAGGQVMSSL